MFFFFLAKCSSSNVRLSDVVWLFRTWGSLEAKCESTDGWHVCYDFASAVPVASRREWKGTVQRMPAAHGVNAAPLSWRFRVPDASDLFCKFDKPFINKIMLMETSRKVQVAVLCKQAFFHFWLQKSRSRKSVLYNLRQMGCSSS